MLRYKYLTISELPGLDRIPSGYTTRMRYHLARSEDGDAVRWSLTCHPLDRPFVKQYDDGDPVVWLESYQEATQPEALRFVGAFDGAVLVGMMTWTHYTWNNRIWLADIRVKEDRRRLGIGTHLLRFLGQEARGAGARGIQVETQTANYPGLHFYLARGFRVCGFDDRLYSNDDEAQGEIAIFLQRDLVLEGAR